MVSSRALHHLPGFAISIIYTASLLLLCFPTAAAFVPGGTGHLGSGALHSGTAAAPSQGRQLVLAASVPEADPSFDISGSLGACLAGACLGLAVLFGAPRSAVAEIEDTPITVDAAGKTTFITREQLVRGKRLFNAACAYCHVQGGTRTNQNVGLAMDELAGAAPARDNLTEMVKYLNEPYTYDGLKDISEVHPSIKSADLYPRMRSMKQNDLYDISVFILYSGTVVPEKWGGGKIYY